MTRYLTEYDFHGHVVEVVYTMFPADTKRYVDEVSCATCSVPFVMQEAAAFAALHDIRSLAVDGTELKYLRTRGVPPKASKT